MSVFILWGSLVKHVGEEGGGWKGSFINICDSEKRSGER